jgi:hypothetical protein
MIANALARRNGGGGVVPVTLPIGAGDRDVFIVKYNTSGVAQWSATVPGTSSDTAYGIATDSTGVYVSGIYSSTAVITLNNEKTLPISVNNDAFIVKYNTSGQAQWVATIRGTSTDAGFAIATDSTGVYVTGLYISTTVVTLNNGKTLPASAGVDAFIVKYDTSGQAQWVATIRGTTDNRAYAIATDSTGVYVTGSYSSSTVVTLNNGKTLPISAGSDAFIVKYDTSGLAQWSATVPGTGSDRGQGIATDSTGVYVTGYYTSTSAITLNDGITTLPISVVQDMFIVKYNTSGLAQWAATIQGTFTDDGYGITTDSTGVYISGSYRTTTVLTLNNGKTLPITAGGSSTDAFIVKYDTSGLAQWSATVPGTSTDNGYGIATDSTGVYVTGKYSANVSTVTLNNGKTLPITVNTDAFIVKYDTSGQAQWATRIRGTSDDTGFAIATDSTGVYVTGEYISTSIVTL